MTKAVRPEVGQPFDRAANQAMKRALRDAIARDTTPDRVKSSLRLVERQIGRQPAR